MSEQIKIRKCIVNKQCCDYVFYVYQNRRKWNNWDEPSEMMLGILLESEEKNKKVDTGTIAQSSIEYLMMFLRYAV